MAGDTRPLGRESASLPAVPRAGRHRRRRSVSGACRPVERLHRGPASYVQEWRATRWTDEPDGGDREKLSDADITAVAERFFPPPAPPAPAPPPPRTHR